MHEAKASQSTRRQVIKAGAIGVGGALAFPAIVPSTVFAKPGVAPPSERIGVGVVGVGGRGRTVMNAFLQKSDAQVRAVCDVDGKRRDGGRDQVNKYYDHNDCAAYIDMFELFDRPDIDAVLIATGDNWHSMASILAAKAGKDIYCEKPLSVTMAESRAVADTIQRYGRVFQCGTQRRNIAQFIFAVELAHTGKLGRLTKVIAEKAWPESGVYDTIPHGEPLPSREVLDWDRWLGPAPWRPFSRKAWSRGYWMKHADFSGGSITEWGAHTVDLCQWANQADDTSAIEYEAYNGKGDVRARYANGVILEIRKGLRFGTCPVRFEGEEGWVEVGDSGKVETHPASLWEGRKFKGGYPPDDHVREFLDCIRTRRNPKATAETAHRSISTCHAANVAVRLGRPVKFDPVTESFPGDPQADRFCARAMREPWQL